MGGGQSNLHLGEVASALLSPSNNAAKHFTSISEDCFCQRFVLGVSLPWVQAIQSL
jgi:hypothetical protein